MTDGKGVYWRGMKKGKDNSATPSPDQEAPASDSLNSNQKKSNGRGGPRPGAGRPVGSNNSTPERDAVLRLKGLIAAHGEEEITLIETDRGTGTTKEIKKPAIVAVMDMLRTAAVKDKSIPAAKEYMDRLLGKPIQALEHSGDIGTGDDQYVPDHPAVQAARDAFYAAIKKNRD